MSDDICDMKSALSGNSPNFAAARAAYATGGNSKKSDGSTRTLKGMATADLTGEPFFDQYSRYFKSKTYVDDAATSALSGGAGAPSDVLARRELASKAAEAQLMMSYSLHELDEAANKIAEGSISLKKGAPHNVDEVAALYFGNGKCSPSSMAARRAGEMGTLSACGKAQAEDAMLSAINAAYAASVKGDAAAFQAARSRVISAYALTMAQGTLSYAGQMEAARAAGKPTAELQAEAYGFYRAIEPLVAQASASSNEAIRKVILPGSPVAAGGAAAVSAALAKAYPGLGITAAQVGTFGAKSAVSC